VDLGRVGVARLAVGVALLGESVRTGLVFSGGSPGAIFTRIVGAPDFTGVSSSTATWTLPCSSRNSWRTTA
jgi:hypothetical protein